MGITGRIGDLPVSGNELRQTDEAKAREIVGYTVGRQAGKRCAAGLTTAAEIKPGWEASGLASFKSCEPQKGRMFRAVAKR